MSISKLFKTQAEAKLTDKWETVAAKFQVGCASILQRHPQLKKEVHDALNLNFTPGELNDSRNYDCVNTIISEYIQALRDEQALEQIYDLIVILAVDSGLELAGLEKENQEKMVLIWLHEQYEGAMKRMKGEKKYDQQ